MVAAVVDAGRDPAEKRVRGVGVGSPRSILILIRRCPAIPATLIPRLPVESPRAELFSILPAGQG